MKLNKITREELLSCLENISKIEARTFVEAVELRTSLNDVISIAERSDIKVPRSVVQKVRLHVNRQLELTK